MRQLVLRNVVAATDLAPSAADALRAAAALARLAGARLHVVHAGGDGGEAALRAHLAEFSPAVAGDAAVLAPPGPPDEVILAAAERVHADVVVMGPHRRGRPGGGLGSTAARVVRRAEAPCLVVPRPLDLPLRRVVAAVDLSDGGRGALLVALSWASALRCPAAAREGGEPGTCIDALHVVSGDTPPEPDRVSLGGYVATVRAAAGGYAGVEIQEVVRPAGASAEPVADAIFRHVADCGAGLLVLGTRAVHAERSLPLGSVSAAVAAQTPVPVLLVPPAVWRRAVEQPELPVARR
ncbi:MAG TPA: universal stress protein [Longimicrobium sp.]